MSVELMNPILSSAAGNLENQDRGLVMQDGARWVLCIADGSGGRSGGKEAAVMAIEFVRQNVSAIITVDLCAELLRKMDSAVTKDPIAGETTCALVFVTATEIFGASVGDSGIWIIPESGSHIDLTRGQERKPCIGTGGAWPVPFRYSMQGGSLLLGTDGLFKYTSAERIIETCRQHPTELPGQSLIELVRYQSGALPDDVTVILSRL